MLSIASACSSLSFEFEHHDRLGFVFRADDLDHAVKVEEAVM